MMRHVRNRLVAVRSSGEQGVALIMVLCVTMILTMLTTAGASYALRQLQQVGKDQNWGSALAAAQAGVDDYVSKLNRDSLYWMHGSASAYSGASFYDGTSGNTAFTTWTAVPNGGTVREYFRYEINNELYNQRGVIKIRASGKVGKSIRTVEAQLRRGSFIDFLYFTDLETQDPALYSPSTSWKCDQYYYAGRSSSCTSIQFASGDVVDGPAHSNDAMLMCVGTATGLPTGTYGPWFKGKVTTNYTPTSGSNRWRQTCDTNTSHLPLFAVGVPSGPVKLDMPPSNSALKSETDPALTSPNPTGCLYTGPTKITMRADGKLDIVSPLTKSPHPVSGCATGTGVALPANGVLYVRTAPATADTYGTAGATTCPTANGVGYPITNDYGATYSCKAGDAFVSGTLDGRLTIAAENNIVVVDDVRYDYRVDATQAQDDLLGLIATNNVEVYHPVSRSGSSGSYTYTNLTTATTNVRIDAAVLSVQHSFRVQNYQYGASLGTLNVFGAIAQKYRGIVGQSGTSGFLKSYVYDKRLQWDSPPKFLNPVQSAFAPTQWSELTPAYAS